MKEETRQKNRRQKKTGQHEREERRQKINFQCGGAWPFLVDGVLCLVHLVNHRVFSLLHRFKYDCSLISFRHLGPSTVFFLRKISANYLFYAVTVQFFEFFCYAATVFFSRINSA